MVWGYVPLGEQRIHRDHPVLQNELAQHSLDLCNKRGKTVQKNGIRLEWRFLSLKRLVPSVRGLAAAGPLGGYGLGRRLHARGS